MMQFLMQNNNAGTLLNGLSQYGIAQGGAWSIPISGLKTNGVAPGNYYVLTNAGGILQAVLFAGGGSGNTFSGNFYINGAGNVELASTLTNVGTLNGTTFNLTAPGNTVTLNLTGASMGGTVQPIVSAPDGLALGGFLMPGGSILQGNSGSINLSAGLSTFEMLFTNTSYGQSVRFDASGNVILTAGSGGTVEFSSANGSGLTNLPGYVYLSAFGVAGSFTGTQDDSPIISNAFAYAWSIGRHSVWFDPPNVYGNIKMFATNWNKTVLTGGTGPVIFAFDPINGFTEGDNCTLHPWDTTIPVIQIGNDTAMVAGVLVTGLNISGKSAAGVEVSNTFVFGPGANECILDNSSVKYGSNRIAEVGGSIYCCEKNRMRSVYTDDFFHQLNTNSADIRLFGGWLNSTNGQYPGNQSIQTFYIEGGEIQGGGGQNTNLSQLGPWSIINSNAFVIMDGVYLDGGVNAFLSQAGGRFSINFQTCTLDSPSGANVAFLYTDNITNEDLDWYMPGAADWSGGSGIKRGYNNFGYITMANPLHTVSVPVGGDVYNKFRGQRAGSALQARDQSDCRNWGEGYQSLTGLSSGQFNYGYGDFTMAFMSRGSNNIAIGYEAFRQSATNVDSIAFGHYAGMNSVYAFTNFFWGEKAGTNASGTNIAVIGNDAGTQIGKATNEGAIFHAGVTNENNNVNVGGLLSETNWSWWVNQTYKSNVFVQSNSFTAFTNTAGQFVATNLVGGFSGDGSLLTGLIAQPPSATLTNLSAQIATALNLGSATNYPFANLTGSATLAQLPTTYGSAMSNTFATIIQVALNGTTATNVFATQLALALQGQTLTNSTQPTNLTLTQICAQIATAMNLGAATNLPLTALQSGGGTTGQQLALNSLGQWIPFTETNAIINSTVTYTNFNFNQTYTNNSGSVQIVQATIVLTNAAVAGDAGAAIMVSNIGWNGYSNVASLTNGTSALSIASIQADGLATVVSNASSFYFTNLSSGAGNGAGIVPSTGTITVIGNAAASGYASLGGQNNFTGSNNFGAAGTTINGNNVITNGQATATNNIGFICYARAIATITTSASYFAPALNTTGTATEALVELGLQGGSWGDNVIETFGSAFLVGTNNYVVIRTNGIPCATNIVIGPVSAGAVFVFQNPLITTNATLWDIEITNNISVANQYISVAVSHRPF